MSKITLDQAAALACTEARRAAQKHPPMHSHHEAYAVIAEEFNKEYWDEICKGGSIPRDPAALRLELIQTAAMCLRALSDLCDGETHAI